VFAKNLLTTCPEPRRPPRVLTRRRLGDVETGSGFDLIKALEELEGLVLNLDDDKIAR
jgi:hypothetical protein